MNILLFNRVLPTQSNEQNHRMLFISRWTRIHTHIHKQPHTNTSILQMDYLVQHFITHEE